MSAVFAEEREIMLRNAGQQIFGLKAENAELRVALTEAARVMKNLSHLSAKYRTLLISQREQP